MGYLVRPSGRLELRAADEPAAVAAVFAAWETHGGARWVSASSASTMADLGEEAAAYISRDGDWIEATDLVRRSATAPRPNARQPSGTC